MEKRQFKSNNDSHRIQFKQRQHGY